MRIFLLATALFFTASIADAQAIRQDVIELGGTGSVDINPVFNIKLAPVVGYFITDKIEVGGNPEISTDFSSFGAFISAFGNYYPTGGTETQTYPFIGVNLGLNVADGGGGIGLGGQAGVQRFLSESAALTLALKATTDDDFNAVSVGVNAGVSFFINRAAAERAVR